MQRTAELEDTRTVDGPLRPLSVIVMIAGAIFVLAGVVTWFGVRDQLVDEKVVVSADAPFLGGDDVDGPFSAYAESRAIRKHALEMSDGLTYAEMDREDPVRPTVGTASFLRASLLTSVIAFGVAAFSFGVGLVLLVVGWALRCVDQALRSPDRAPVRVFS
jgi:hypothetical protein